MIVLLKNILISLLVFSLSIGNSLAMSIDQYEEAKDAALAAFRKEVYAALKYEERIGEEHVREGYLNALSFARFDMNNMSFFLSSIAEETNSIIEPLEQIAIRIQSLTTQSIDLINYGEILSSYFLYEKLVADFNNNLSTMKIVYQEFEKYEKDFEDVCKNSVPRLKKPTLSLPPNPDWEVEYDRISNTINDPLTKVYFETTLSVSILAGLLTYGITYGAGATFALFGATAIGGEYLITTSNPAGVAILAASLVFSYTVALWKQQEENADRKKRAREADDKLSNGINEIRTEFLEKQLTPAEFTSKAFDICNMSLKSGEISRYKSNYLTTKSKIEKQLEEIEATRNLLEKNWNSLGKIIGVFYSGLNQKYQDIMLRDYRDDILSKEKLTRAANIFNDEVIPLTREASQFFIKEKNNCILLRDYFDNLEYEVLEYKSQLLNYRDDRNIGKGIFIDVEQRLDGIIKNFKTRLVSCSENLDLGGGILVF